jgi:microcystin-dependent protein
MTVEVATYIADLQAVNPPATDPRSQGDDHLRLIKQVLQNSFGGSSRQWQIPGAKFVSANYTVLKVDGESTILVDTTSGAVTLSLPVLVAGDVGWKVYIIKTNTGANPIFVTPPSGTISSGGVGVSSSRRSIPGVRIPIIWYGTGFLIERATGLPIGSCIEYHGSALPAGYEWPNGQTLSSAANYPEYNVVMGGLTTQDKRGRIGVTLDNLGGTSAGRLAGGFITGTAVGNSGGVDGVTLSATQIPAHQHPVFLKFTDPNHSHTVNGIPTYNGSQAGGGGAAGSAGGAISTGSSSTGITVTIGSVSGTANDNQTAANTGGGGAHSNLQPSLMVSSILVVE